MSNTNIKELEKQLPKLKENEEYVYRGTGWSGWKDDKVKYVYFVLRGSSLDDGVLNTQKMNVVSNAYGGFSNVHYWEIVENLKKSFEEELKYAKSLIGKTIESSIKNSFPFNVTDVKVFVNKSHEMPSSVEADFYKNDCLYSIAVTNENSFLAIPASECTIKRDIIKHNKIEIEILDDEVVFKTSEKIRIPFSVIEEIHKKIQK